MTSLETDVSALPIRGGAQEAAWPIVLWAAVAFGCAVAHPLPWVLPCMALAIWFVTRKPALVVVALAMVASIYSASQWHHLNSAVPGSVSGVATIVRDPESSNHSTRAEIKVDGRHYMASAYGSAAYQLRPLLAGDRIRIEGPTRAISGVAAPAYRRRHIAAGMSLSSVVLVDHGNFAARTANGVRSLIARGAKPVPATEQTLLTGFVYGDDRNETDQMQQDFEDSGLSHLLAVSGENVAFVLLLLAPLLRRFSLHGRFVGGLIALLLFGLITRWEPSVVRAEMMAFVALVAIYRGRPVSKWRCLALGSTLALLIDPFLIGSVGFLMSVSACIGMAGLGEVFYNHMRGGQWFRRAVSYSAAAQIGVAPAQLLVFHQLPTVGLITNVLAEPIAGIVMMWGVVGGLIAGVMPWSALSMLLHLPDWLLLSAVRIIAHYGAVVEDSSTGKWLGAAVTIGICVVFGIRRAPTTVDADG